MAACCKLPGRSMDNANWQVLLLVFLFTGPVLLMIAVARRAPSRLFIRRLPGMNAIDEAIGRAAEEGTPVIMSPGIESINNIQTLAGLGVLEYVAKACARFEARLVVTTCKPVLVPICEEVLKSAFSEAGRPEMMDRCEVRFISPATDLTALGTVRIMNDEKAASCLYFGSFDYTSLMYTEGGQMAGCMQIAATAEYYQIPFFIASCDYVLIVEELFACSSYLNREPTMMGSVVGQDYAKLMLLTILLIGVGTVTWFGLGNPANLFESLLRY